MLEKGNIKEKMYGLLEPLEMNFKETFFLQNKISTS